MVNICIIKMKTDWIIERLKFFSMRFKSITYD